MKKEDKNKIYQLLELIYPEKSKEVLDNIINNIDNDISSDYLGNEFKDWDQKTCVLITYADSIYEEKKKFVWGSCFFRRWVFTFIHNYQCSNDLFSCF